MLSVCQMGFEALLAGELAAQAISTVEKGPGWVRTQDTPDQEGLSVRGMQALVFPHLTWLAPLEISGEAVNALAHAVADWFMESIRDERIEANWPVVWMGAPEIVGLGRRVDSVEKAWAEILRKKLSRVAKLARSGIPREVRGGEQAGLFVYFLNFQRAFVSRKIWVHGSRRVADDPLAPSRSYLKMEEAFLVFGHAPQAGETVCDLGAAPGGWSYSAARRGARVIAVDNGPLKGGALGNPNITHLTTDAFRFTPEAASPFAWMFCDLVEEPHHVLKNLVEPWLERGWCRRFIFNLKFGRVDAQRLIDDIRSPQSVLSRLAPGFLIRHLYHDREEFTVMGEVASLAARPAD